MAAPKCFNGSGDVPLFKSHDGLCEPLASISNEARGLAYLSNVLSNITFNITLGSLYKLPKRLKLSIGIMTGARRDRVVNSEPAESIKEYPS
jgi:hypothetical protein